MRIDGKTVVVTGGADGIERESFLILPHLQVADYMQRKAAKYDRWIGGMAKVQTAMHGRSQ